MSDPRGLTADQTRQLAAVTAGLTLPWNSGVVEGHINRIKVLKRQMYGRANPTCSAAASSWPTNDQEATPTEIVPEPES